MAEKDLEMLGEVASATRTDSLPERIARLKREIALGETVYSGSELRLLQRRLEECELQLDVLLRP